ncbi:hypothetical protein ERHA55_00170 [Erwinia rhapontici]|uniref:Uncharacterized protein n=1 Tax=Erwinia rhapontici TaxID=55212 RepID=A0ABN6DDP2_ERWRD|nr:hypothetical protein ERHA53_00150 [Erwinia rhapontici]BCQ42490.1 hypothetical protein ERHA55_00170 [Erwinia rhapontici]
MPDPYKCGQGNANRRVRHACLPRTNVGRGTVTVGAGHAPPAVMPIEKMLGSYATLD